MIDDVELERLRLHISNLRTAIDLEKERGPHQEFRFKNIDKWPDNCCHCPFVFFMLFKLNYRGMRRKTGDVSRYGDGYEKHVWIELDGVTIDITADQFTDVHDRIIVSRDSPWHAGLQVNNDQLWGQDSDDIVFERHKSHLNTDYSELKTFLEILQRYFPNEYSGWD